MRHASFLFILAEQMKWKPFHSFHPGDSSGRLNLASSAPVARLHLTLLRRALGLQTQWDCKLSGKSGEFSIFQRTAPFAERNSAEFKLPHKKEAARFP